MFETGPYRPAWPFQHARRGDKALTYEGFVLLNKALLDSSLGAYAERLSRDYFGVIHVNLHPA